jgi:signal transduction histidine kinase
VSEAPEVVTALTHQGEQIGSLRTVAGRRLRSRHTMLLESVARQIAPIVHSRHLGDELRHSRDRLAMAQLAERRRLRRDLHDGLGPTLAALAFKVDTARNVLSTDPAAESMLLEIRDRLRDAVSDVRRVVDGLRPPYLQEFGLSGALTRLVADLPGPTEFRLRLSGDEEPIAEAAQVAVYRIVQEALTNVVRHAKAASCDVLVTVNGSSVQLTISDDGTGEPPDDHGNGHGLATMRERADELGGTLMVVARPGVGTALTLTLPR